MRARRFTGPLTPSLSLSPSLSRRERDARSAGEGRRAQRAVRGVCRDFLSLSPSLSRRLKFSLSQRVRSVPNALKTPDTHFRQVSCSFRPFPFAGFPGRIGETRIRETGPCRWLPLPSGPSMRRSRARESGASGIPRSRASGCGYGRPASRPMLPATAPAKAARRRSAATPSASTGRHGQILVLR